METKLEEMGRFFDSRVDTYEEHMMNEVNGAKQAYIEIARYIPVKAELNLLDLGCGTGLELEEIFQKNPDMKVTGIDLSAEMLVKLKEKYKDKRISLNQVSYFDFPYGIEEYDAAVSSMTMHHFNHEDKIRLYSSICTDIKPGGRYIECDYMIKDQETEDFYYSENERIRKEQGITDGFYHYDTPCTVENQISMLKQAGFAKVTLVWEIGTTVILVCDK